MTIDLSTYVRVGRYDLPEPTRSTAPLNNLLGQEASGVAYNWDTGTLFLVGDGGQSVTEVSITGQFISTMTLALGSSPQGTEFYDPEGIAYIGNGQFVMTEERDRNAVKFTYQAGTTLNRSGAQTVDLGTFSPNLGLEGLTYDPLTGGFIFVKEKQPLGVFQTTIDFDAGTASNGSPSTENSIDLFNPNLLGLIDIADVFALSNISSLAGTDEESNLLILSQESGKIVEVDRAGNVLSSLTLQTDPDNPLNIVAQGHEGISMGPDGTLYVVSENGGGNADRPQLWVYKASNGINAAPTEVIIANATTALLENTSTATRLKVADVYATDDGLGTNAFSVSGADAAFFEVDNTGLYVKSGTTLDFETKTSYNVTVNVDDVTLGTTPDASTSFTLDVTDVVNEGALPTVYISEVAPWSSGNSPVNADWFEVTNGGTTTLNITGWKVDDNSNSFANSILLNGITSIAPGESVIFMESSNPATATAAFRNNWFGANAPAGLQIGTYTGSGIGFGTGGDAVNLYNAAGVLQANIVFGSSPTGPYATFDNAAGLNNATISTLSVDGAKGAFKAVNSAPETGSPGAVAEIAPVIASNGGGSTALVQINENISAVTTVTATDRNFGDAVAYSITGGADAAKFVIDANTGALGFVEAPNFEAPTDAGQNNFYDVVVTASDGSLTDSQAIQVRINNVSDTAPFITSNGAGVAASITVDENVAAVTTVTASDDIGDALTYSIAGGADAAKFAIDSATGELTFISAPNFELPTDAGADNVYDVAVSVSDGTFTDSQSIAVTVSDVLDTGSFTGTSRADTFTVTNAFDFTVRGLAGNDVLTGNIGNDDIDGGLGNDIINGAAGNDLLEGGVGNDFINGGDDADTLSGSAGNDVINGDSGADLLNGGGGIDTLNGGSEDDILIGGAQRDILTGGDGADQFVLNDTQLLGDTITDFALREDKIVLDRAVFTAFIGSDSVAANQFAVGTKATTAEQRLIYDQPTGRLYYDADGTGSGAKKLVATLTNAAGIGADDFVLQGSAAPSIAARQLVQAMSQFGIAGSGDLDAGDSLSAPAAIEPKLMASTVY